MTLSIRATRELLAGKTPSEIFKWLNDQVDEGRREKANDPNLSEAERMKC